MGFLRGNIDKKFEKRQNLHGGLAGTIVEQSTPKSCVTVLSDGQVWKQYVARPFGEKRIKF